MKKSFDFVVSNEPTLPIQNWNIMKNIIKVLGEENKPLLVYPSNQNRFLFLQELRIVDDDYLLTPIGKKLFHCMFIRMDNESERVILRDLLSTLPSFITLQQNLWGLEHVSIDQVVTVLKSTNLWEGNSKESLTNFLDFLNYVGLITYNRRKREIKIKEPISLSKVSTSFFIDPKRPFSNILGIESILAKCEGSIYWFDKHFQKEGLEWLLSVADVNKINKIRILSLDLGDKNIRKEVVKLYKRLKTELKYKNIDLLWNVIDSKFVKDSHDRWIFDDKQNIWNIPNVNAISSGQQSEILKSGGYIEIAKSFENYWKESNEV